jgi:hypothetical protein
MSSSVQKVSVKSKTHSKSIHSIFRKSILFLNLLVPVPFLILRFFKISIMCCADLGPSSLFPTD